MKHCLLLLLLFLLAACTSQTPINPTNTPGPLVTQTSEPAPTALLTTAPTPTYPTQQPVATNDNLPFTTTPTTPTLQPISTTLPVPSGRIIFLWNQRDPPAYDGPVKVQPTVGLFQATPNNSPDNWHIQPLLTNIFAITPCYLAPDQSKLALLVYNEEMSPYSNFYQIWVYTFTTGQITHIENQEYLDTLSWLPDSETIVYPQNTNLFQVKLTDLIPQQLTQNSPPLAENGLNGYIGQMAGSSNGFWQAVNWLPGDLALYNVSLQTTAVLANQIGNDFLKLDWSSNSQWLSFTKNYGLDLYVANTETLSVTQLAVEPNSIYYSDWSPDSRWLAFTQSSVLSLWDTETQTTGELLRSGFIGEPAWSPDGLTLATGFVEGTEAGLLLIQVNTGEVVKMNLGMTTSKIIWSPDGQWLLFPSSQNEQSGLYLIHRSSDTVYLVLDTTGKLHNPDYIIWLPEEIFSH